MQNKGTKYKVRKSEVIMLVFSLDDDAGLTSFADSMDLTAAVHSYTQHGGFISPFDIFAFQSVRQEG